MPSGSAIGKQPSLSGDPSQVTLLALGHRAQFPLVMSSCNTQLQGADYGANSLPKSAILLKLSRILQPILFGEYLKGNEVN